MTVTDTLTVLCGLVGAFFFLGGTVGLLRFPDLFSRLHALTKADNLGLGLIVLGLLFQVDSIAAGMKLVLIWGIALWAGSTSCYTIGRYYLEKNEPRSAEAKEGADGD